MTAKLKLTHYRDFWSDFAVHFYFWMKFTVELPLTSDLHEGSYSCELWKENENVKRMDIKMSNLYQTEESFSLDSATAKT